MNIKRILIYVVWIAVLSALIGGCSVIVSIKNDLGGLFGGLPSLKSLERPESDLSSEMFSSDGVSLGKYFRYNRTAVEYNELSQELITTLLVTEDIRFTKHSGIDLIGLLRAISGAITFQFKGGGSTLTMQLAENLYQTSTENQGSLYSNRKIGQVITKIKEWMIAIELEKSYTKEEILAMYLNTIEYGANSYGIKVACKTFFNKLPADITYKEAAILVSLINAPTRYNPVRNPENALAKRTEVLYNLHKYEHIDRTSYDSLNASDFGLQYKVANQNQGLATYFRSVIRRDLMSWSKKNGYDLFADGLKIYTTIDSRLQKYAEQATKEHMSSLQSTFDKHLYGNAPWIDENGNEKLDFIDNAIKRTPNYKALVKRFGEESDSVDYYLNLPKKMSVFSYEGEIDTTFSLIDSLKYFKQFLQTGFMAMDPKTGHIKAWVGGIDHKHFKYDHVKQGKRQPGSTFKPFIYAAAIDLGYSPCYTVVDAPVTWVTEDPENPTWTPKNADGKYSGKIMTIRKAMANSINSITANIMQKISPKAAVDMARACGIESDLLAVPPLCLGAGGDVSLYELVGAYSTFVNQGTWTQPYYITRIEDKNGVVLEEFVPKRREAISEKTAYLMLHMLKGAVEEIGGTGRSLDWSLKQNNDIGAKTGTTQSASDGWFMGVTENLVGGAWVGGDDRAIRFRNWAMGQGARTARPIWAKFMLKVYDDPLTGIEKAYFRKPSTDLGVQLDCDLYTDTGASSTDTLGIIDNIAEDFENIDF